MVDRKPLCYRCMRPTMSTGDARTNELACKGSCRTTLDHVSRSDPVALRIIFGSLCPWCRQYPEPCLPRRKDQNSVVRLCGFIIHEGNAWLAASPGGMETAGQVVLEIKCPTPDTLKKYGSQEGLIASGKYNARYNDPELILSAKGKNA
ncbi:hypothetical protein HPB47_012506 [Ixodes persulcatus]|uniref:Uncharacterized protein n=1 Tax=Ixodes persulcatus TaxID=34615 RepID=A0AC60NT91_IXOPE|nr:hypothetical protein HPB47_012506 [Ixodes persulcatus]